MLRDTVRDDTTRSDTVRYGTVRYDTTRGRTCDGGHDGLRYELAMSELAHLAGRPLGADAGGVKREEVEEAKQEVEVEEAEV